MKNKTVIFSMCVLAMTSFSLMAQQDMQQQNGKPNQEKFAEHKQMMIQRMQEPVSEIQQRIGYVQNAQDPASLRACFPERRKDEKK